MMKSFGGLLVCLVAVTMAGAICYVQGCQDGQDQYRDAVRASEKRQEMYRLQEEVEALKAAKK